MRCRTFQTLVSAHLDGRLAEERRAEFDAHRDACGACSAWLAELMELESSARRATAVAPPAGFTRDVVRRAEGGLGAPRTLPVTIAEPAARRARFPVGVAAGVALGIFLGLATPEILRSLTTGPVGPEAPAAVQAPGGGETAPQPSLSDVTLHGARERVGDFVNASDTLAGDIASADWKNPLDSVAILNRIVDGIDMEKRIEEAEKVREVIGRHEPRCIPVLSTLLGDQRDILECLGDQTASPETLAEIRTKAMSTMGNARLVRNSLNMDFPHYARIFGRMDLPDPPAEVLGLPEGEQIAFATRKAMEGENDLALAIYKHILKSNPASPNKVLVISRQARTWKAMGRDDKVILVLEEAPRFFRPGEVDPNLQMHIEVLLDGTDSPDPGRKERIRRQVLLKSPQPWCMTDIRTVKIGDVEILVDGRGRERGMAFGLLSLLENSQGGARTRSESQSPEGKRMVHVVFEPSGSLPRMARVFLEKLASTAALELPDGECLRIEFQGE